MIMPLVSVIMPNFNGAKFLCQAIESVVNQTFDNWELIIIDDSSDDESLELIQRYADKDGRILLLNNEINSGVAFSRNRGISLASGKYIAFLDSDDVWLPQKLERQIELFNKYNCKIAYSAYEVINESNDVLGKVIPPEKLNYNRLLKSNYIGNLTGIFDAAALGKPIVFDMGHEDYILWLDLLKKTDFAYGTEEVLARYRKKEKSVSSNKLRTIKWQWRIYRDHQKFNFFKSLYLMVNYGFHGLFKIKKI